MCVFPFFQYIYIPLKKTLIMYPLESVIKSFKLLIHENIGYYITNCKRRNNILKAYASQKYTMKKNQYIFFIATDIKHVKFITEKSLMNYLIIYFKAFLIPMTLKQCLASKLLVVLDDTKKYKEIECRRFINPNNLILQKKLGISCNDFSNLNFKKRDVEINLMTVQEDGENKNRKFRCIINNKTGYYIQEKRVFKYRENFINEIQSFELLCYSVESPKFDDSCVFILDLQNNVILGLASFLDCNDVSIKTTYLDDDAGTVLYQRINIDDYKRQQYFILEHEFGYDDAEASLRRYFDISCLLDARLPKNIAITNGYANASTKPIDGTLASLEKKKQNLYLKLDGILANLKFYNSHFVISTNTYSNSFTHSLPKSFIHRLRDFSFIVESHLYQSMFSKFNKPYPMAIIDIHNLSFSAIKRMNIIQNIKKIMGRELEKYFIFFQGDELVSNIKQSPIYIPPNIHRLKNNRVGEYIHQNFIFFVREGGGEEKKEEEEEEESLQLSHGKIYEVRINERYNITSVIKARPDKLHPNSRNCINNIVKTIGLKGGALCK